MAPRSRTIALALALLTASPASGQGPAPVGGAVAREVARLADALKAHPADRKARAANPDEPAQPLQLYMREVATGEVTLIADEPEPGFVYCSKPCWSPDGTTIVFDVRPSFRFPQTRLKRLSLTDNRPKISDLGPGACPSLSPDGKRLAFLGVGEQPGEPWGVWLTDLNGKGKQRISDDYAAPFWSPDGREFLLNAYKMNPTDSTVIDVGKAEGGLVQVEGRQQLYSWASWAGPHTLVAVLGPEGESKGDRVARLDVTKPEAAKVIEVLWERPEGSDDLGALWPVYWPPTGRCFFVGFEGEKRTLLTVRRGKSKKAEAVEGKGYNDMLGGLAFSPDGRFLLFCADRPAPVSK